MSHPQDKVLLIWNHWEWKATDPLSLAIRVVTSGPNHSALKKRGVVHEMVGSSLWWTIKKALGRPVSYEANKGSGYKTTPYEEWAAARSRIVIEMDPEEDGELPEVTEGYGFLDLPQIFLSWVRKKWLLIGHKWNGKDGTRLWKGTLCHEYILRYLGLPDDYVLAPVELLTIPQLRKTREFITKKNHGEV